MTEMHPETTAAAICAECGHVAYEHPEVITRQPWSGCMKCRVLRVAIICRHTSREVEAA